MTIASHSAFASPQKTSLDGRDIFIFDLDNTLYPAECHLFHQIDQRMMAFIIEHLDMSRTNARYMQKDLYTRYGTTLSGLMREHNIKPQSFLEYVHDIDLSGLPENPALFETLTSLPGTAYIFTNGSVSHAENVAGKLGILDAFEGIFDIVAANYVPKPHAETYHRFAERFGIIHERAVMFEDLAINLEVPSQLGQATVLIQSRADWLTDEPTDKRPATPGAAPGFVQHQTEDLTAFLRDAITR